MQIEAIGEALAASWRVHARCLEGTVDYTRSKAKCHYLAELGHERLVWAEAGAIRFANAEMSVFNPCSWTNDAALPGSTH
jgi:hypothetical protein